MTFSPIDPAHPPTLLPVSSRSPWPNIQTSIQYQTCNRDSGAYSIILNTSSVCAVHKLNFAYLLHTIVTCFFCANGTIMHQSMQLLPHPVVDAVKKVTVSILNISNNHHTHIFLFKLESEMLKCLEKNSWHREQLWLYIRASKTTLFAYILYFGSVVQLVSHNSHIYIISGFMVLTL